MDSQNRVTGTRRAKHLPSKASKLEGKVHETYSRLLGIAQKLGPHAKLPTVRELKEDLNVSQATLDAAFVRLEGQNILVRRQGSGVYVSPRLRLRNIILLCNPEYFMFGDSSPFWRLLVRQIREIAERNEAHLTLHFVRPHVEQELNHPQDAGPLSTTIREEIVAGGVHGIITVGVLHPVARWIEAQGVPVVAYAGAAEYVISHSNVSMIQMGVAALARAGCRRIDPWFFSPISAAGNNAYTPLYTVYKGAMLAHGLSPSPALEMGGEDEGSADTDDVFAEYYRIALERYSRKPRTEERPIGIVSPNDMHTQAALMALYRIGLRPNRDIKIATHSNAGSTALLAWHPEIIRVEFDPAEIVRYLFETLDAMMNNEAPRWLSRAVRTPEWMYLVEPSLILPDDDL